MYIPVCPRFAREKLKVHASAEQVVRQATTNAVAC